MPNIQPTDPECNEEDISKKALENSNQAAKGDLSNPNFNIAAMDPDEWAWRKDNFWCD